ncbi:unnamed protein product [Leptidea sinapis]|uniref:Uncharacterized protein n=1 Tax=Leptidea sinapis TaxID=189913 RepID=A0A5E4QSS3_9NEOP|nr:unnamed protein product [Leptidea sinapis]
MAPEKHCFVKQTLASLAHSPNQLAVDKVTNSLYFSFDSGRAEYLPASLKIETRKLTILHGIKDAFAIASDEANSEIYFGGIHGIYRYNTMTKTLRRLVVKNLDIWWLILKKHLYFVRFPSLKAYCYKNRSVEPVRQLQNYTVNQFVFDGDNNIFFINGSGLFGIKKDKSEAVLLKDNPKFLCMASDNLGHIHLCAEDGIYIISKIVLKVKKVVNVQGVLGMTFDSENNLIYSDSHEMVRLLPIPTY